MKTRSVGHSGLQVSEVALGSWLTLGSSVEMGQTTRLVEHAFDRGINFYDTADVYANGQAETALGQAISGLPRHQLVLASKCFFPMSAAPNDRGLSRKHVVESVEASLRRLGTDYLDLHQCHRYDPETPLEETVRTYGDLIRQGKLLYWGVSEWNATQVEATCECADRLGEARPISNQPVYSILRRGIEAEVVPACRRAGLGQVVFSPLGQGVLTGKYAAGRRPADSRANDQRHNQWMDAYLEESTVARVEELRPLADGLGCSMAQLALAWCLRDTHVSSVIVGATRPEQLDDNCGASGLAIPDDVLARIDALFPGPTVDADV